MDIPKTKEDARLLENKQNALLIKFIQQQRKYFDFADTMHWISFQKKEEDFLMICEAFTNWTVKLPDDDKRKTELSELLQSTWRLQGYCVSLETMVQTSVSKYTSTNKRNDELVSEKRTLELQMIQLKTEYEKKIKCLEEEIKHHESTSPQ